jgi:hypothetical protein
MSTMYKKLRINDEDDMLTYIRTLETPSDAIDLVRRVAKKFNLDSSIIQDDSGLSLFSLLNLV